MPNVVHIHFNFPKFARIKYCNCKTFCDTVVFNNSPYFHKSFAVLSKMPKILRERDFEKFKSFYKSCNFPQLSNLYCNITQFARECEQLLIRGNRNKQQCSAADKFGARMQAPSSTATQLSLVSNVCSLNISQTKAKILCNFDVTTQYTLTIRDPQGSQNFFNIFN